MNRPVNQKIAFGMMEDRSFGAWAVESDVGAESHAEEYSGQRVRICAVINGLQEENYQKEIDAILAIAYLSTKNGDDWMRMAIENLAARSFWAGVDSAHKLAKDNFRESLFPKDPRT